GRAALHHPEADVAADRHDHHDGGRDENDDQTALRLALDRLGAGPFVHRLGLLLLTAPTPGTPARLTVDTTAVLTAAGRRGGGGVRGGGRAVRAARGRAERVAAGRRTGRRGRGRLAEEPTPAGRRRRRGVELTATSRRRVVLAATGLAVHTGRA